MLHGDCVLGPLALLGLVLASPILPGQATNFEENLEGARSIAELAPSEDSTQPNFAPNSDWDNELGVRVLLRESPAYRAMTLRLNQGFYFTDNAGFADTSIALSEESDGYSTTHLGLTYLPRIWNNLYGDVIAHQYSYRYLDQTQLDFDDSRLGLGGVYVFRRLGDLSVSARYQYNRLWQATFDEVHLEEHSILTGFYKPFILDRHHFLYLRGLAEFSFDAKPFHAQRNEYALRAGYRYNPEDKWEFDLYYRLRALDYQKIDRNDIENILGAQLRYELTEKVSLGLSASYVINDSTARGFDYEAGSAGVFFGFRYKR